MTNPLTSKIVAEIRRQRRGILLLEGPPASGKSILGRTLEYELSRSWMTRFFRRRKLFVVQGKKESAENVAKMLDEAARLLPAGSIVIFDDIHLHLLKVSSAAQLTQTRDVLLILISRPIANYPAAHSESLMGLRPRRFEISAELVATTIVEQYLTIGLGLESPSRYHDIFRGYSGDLWLLSAALQSAELIGSDLNVSHDSINEWVRDHLVGDESVENRTLPRSLIIAVLASLYRYEVPTARDFLVRVIGVADEDIRTLTDRGEVLIGNAGRTVRLHHSSLADLIIESLSVHGAGATSVPTLLLDRTLLGGGAGWPDEVVAWHVETEVDRSPEMLSDVSRSSEEGRQLAIRILRRLAPGDDVVQAIRADVASVEATGTLLRLWGQAGMPVSETLIDVLRIYAREAPVDGAQTWAWAVVSGASLDKDVGIDLARRLAPLVQNVPVEQAGSISATISYADADVAKIAVMEISPERIEEGILELDPPARVTTLAKLVWVDERLGDRILNLPSLLQSSPPDDFAQLLGRLAWGNPFVAARLVAATDPSELALVASGCTRRGSILEFFGSLANIERRRAAAAIDWFARDGYASDGDPEAEWIDLLNDLRNLCVAAPDPPPSPLVCDEGSNMPAEQSIVRNLEDD